MLVAALASERTSCYDSTSRVDARPITPVLMRGLSNGLPFLVSETVVRLYFQLLAMAAPTSAPEKGACTASRAIVLWSTPKVRAIAACISPWESRWMTSARWRAFNCWHNDGSRNRCVLGFGLPEHRTTGHGPAKVLSATS